MRISCILYEVIVKLVFKFDVKFWILTSGPVKQHMKYYS